MMQILKDFKKRTTNSKEEMTDIFDELIEEKRLEIKNRKQAGNLSAYDAKNKQMLIKMLEDMLPKIAGKNVKETLMEVKKEFDRLTKEMKKQATEAEKKMSNAFIFCEECFSEGQEILILVTELTANIHTSKFISKFGCKEYFKHNKELLFYDRQQEILNQLDLLDE